MELSDLQKHILEAPDKKIVVMSSAASGKSRLMVEKVRQLLLKGYDPKKIAVITFTNMAAAELRQRLGADYKDGLFVGTIHSLANYMLLSSGIKTNSILSDGEFDELFEMVKAHPECVKPMDWVLVDEAQDTDKEQFEFLLEIINPSHFFLIGDIKQSIYGWRGARPDILLKIARAPDVTTFNMNENYRNGSNILTFAKKIIKVTGMEDRSISKVKDNGTVTKCVFNLLTISKTARSEEKYSDLAILTRTNKEIADIIAYLKRENIPYDTFKQGDLDKEELIDRMNNNTVKVLTVHSAKGLEWKDVIVIGMRSGPAEEINIGYVAATRAKENLIWMTTPTKPYKAKKKPEPKIKIYEW